MNALLLDALPPTISLSFDHPLVARLGWTLLHFLWQGAAAAALLALALALLRNRTAQARYAAACAGMGAMIACPVLTFVLLGAGNAPAPETSRANIPTGIIETAAAAESPLAASHRVAPLTDVSSGARVHPLVVTTWLAGVFALSAWRLCGWLVLRHNVRTHSAPVAPRIEQSLRRLSDALGVRRAVALVESAWVRVPAVVGVFRPVILMPASALTGLTALQLEAILAHELAHVRRHDYLVNLLQAAAETVLFYHPAVWWVSARVREEREHCCDDVASAAGAGGDRVAYARALAAMEGLRVPAGGLALAAAGDGRPGSLMRRVRRLLNASPARDPRRFTAARCLAAAAVAATCAVVVSCAVAPARSARAAGADAGAAAPAGAGDVRPEDLVPDANDYKIVPDDILAITISDLVGPGKETVKNTRVTRTGTISLPYVGEVKVAGLSTTEAERAIIAAYRQAKLVENAAVSVTLSEARGNRFSVMGDVPRPANYAIQQADFRLLDALVGAGAGNDVEEVTVIRPAKAGANANAGAGGAAGQAPGARAAERVIRIPARKLLEGDLNYNLVIRPGDVVRVTGGPPPSARLVAAADGNLMFEGRPTTWEQLPALLEQLGPERRARTRLLLVPASDEMTLKQLRDLRTRAASLAGKFGMKDLAVAEAEAPAEK